MPKFDYDLFVIGAGSGGVRAARLAAMSGARVGIAEEDRVGGTCVIRGCVPKKFMVYASEFSAAFKTAEGFGWSKSQATFDWPTFLQAKDNEIARLSGIYVTNLQNAGADLAHARAELRDAHTIALNDRDSSYSVDKVLIATGGRPTKPDIPGIEFAITSNEAFHLKELPKKMLIVGGGYIAVEFAGIFNGLGVDVTLMYRGANILRGFDNDVRTHLTGEMQRRGIKVMLGCEHTRLEETDGGIKSSLTDGHELTCDVVMYATGREPYTQGLGLETAGVALNGARGAVVVDDYSKTNVDNIWAVGDVTDRINLTPVAIREGAAFAETEFYGRPTSFDHDMVASAVFSQPPVGAVGMIEADARHHYGKVDIYRAVFRPMKATFYGGEERMLMKLIVDPATDKLLGCHVVGPDAPEMIQMAAIALKMGATKAQWDSTCAVHPTAAEELVTMREKYVPLGMAG
ncbi:MAG TPA: glutathione-disulfide reductase [Caulobacteraceae bacterium]|jgi:glutathione reductase (NADPH)|nr:glutathione-disulfide reductase [Caulobacteraceae bacterium]